jgi:hypothetical protein
MKKTELKIFQNAEGKYEVVARPCKISDLARFYGLCDKTIRKRVRAMESEIGKMVGYYLTTAQVEFILKELGVPTNVVLE